MLTRRVRPRRRGGELLDVAVALCAIVPGLLERLAWHRVARRVAVALAAVGVLVLVLSLLHTGPASPCRVPGHARAALVECQQR